MRVTSSRLVVLFVLVSIARPLNAQDAHSAPIAVLESAVQAHVASRDADRAAVLRLLARPEVREIADHAGLDLRRAERAVTTVDQVQLAEVAAHARRVEGGLAGGQSRATISSTMVIIGLLVIILIIVAVD